MNFRPELAAKVMAGEKTVTRRFVSDNPRSPWWREECALKVGRDYAICPGRAKPAIGRVTVVAVSKGPIGTLSLPEVLKEGFDSPASFLGTWLKLHGSFDPHAIVWRIAFEALQ